MDNMHHPSAAQKAAANAETHRTHIGVTARKKPSEPTTNLGLVVSFVIFACVVAGIYVMSNV